MEKQKIIRLAIGFIIYSTLYFVISYFFKLPNMCFDDLTQWDCLKTSLTQTLFFGAFITVFDAFTLRKFSEKRNNNK